MLELWYNADMDAETPLYYIYQDKQRIILVWYGKINRFISLV